jgi:CxxC-x17-CxxC domain-containing protein
MAAPTTSTTIKTEDLDIDLVCEDCKSVFEYTAGEQKWYARFNLVLPKRCKPCREERKKKATKSVEVIANGRPMWTITCEDCGSPAVVPFKPAPFRAVFCGECYRTKKN